MDFLPLYYPDRLKLINPSGHVGIVTLWTPLEDITIEANGKRVPIRGFLPELREKAPEILSENSPVAVISNLYGNGLPQMLANLLHNPQIERIAITGADTVKSGKALENFFDEGVERICEGDIEYLRIIGSPSYPLDLQLTPDRFNVSVERFGRRGGFEALTKFINHPRDGSYSESDRQPIELSVPKFSDYPSEVSLPKIIVRRPLDAWMEVLYHLDRFGKNVDLDRFKDGGGKGKRRTLSNFDVVITDPVFENEGLLRQFNFDPNGLRDYQKEILSGQIPEKQPYSYGSRLRTHFGIDQLEEIVQRLAENPLDRHSLAVTWDPKKDLPLSERDSSSPCLTDIYFQRNKDERLMMGASFRTHNAISAYLINLYGLMSIQDYVSKESGIPKGQIEVRSRWLGINPDDAKTVTALKMIEQKRNVPLNFKDPRGYAIIEAEGDRIILKHYTQEHQLLDEYSGQNVLEIKDALRNKRVFSDPDHAMWIGHELARAYSELHGELPEL